MAKKDFTPDEEQKTIIFARIYYEWKMLDYTYKNSGNADEALQNLLPKRGKKLIQH